RRTWHCGRYGFGFDRQRISS
ncbi:hypothetical protein D046_1043B, partial [Vibrio parahaemolyticus V-223/04]